VELKTVPYLAGPDTNGFWPGGWRPPEFEAGQIKNGSIKLEYAIIRQLFVAICVLRHLWPCGPVASR